MTVATITTDINIGPFKIPSNGQSMIMNNYAQRNNLAVDSKFFSKALLHDANHSGIGPS